MRARTLHIVGFLAFITSVASSQAAVISTTGAIVFREPPQDIRQNKWESNTEIRGFQETASRVLTRSITFDIPVPGSQLGARSNVLPAGTVVASYFFHFDPVSAPDGETSGVELVGSVTFSEPIYGVIVKSATLDQTRPDLGRPNIVYSTDLNHGEELSAAYAPDNDVVTVSQDRKTVSVDLRSERSIDEMRIVTAGSPVPEPGSIGLLIGAGVLAVARRRDR